MVDIANLMVKPAFEDGGWVGDFRDLPDVELRVRNIGSKKYRAEISKKIDAMSPAARRRNSPETTLRMTKEALVAVILLDWRGIEHEGKPLPYSRDWAEKLIESPAFLDAVQDAASRVGKPWEDDAATDEPKAPAPAAEA